MNPIVHFEIHDDSECAVRLSSGVRVAPKSLHDRVERIGRTPLVAIFISTIMDEPMNPGEEQEAPMAPAMPVEGDPMAPAMPAEEEGGEAAV